MRRNFMLIGQLIALLLMAVALGVAGLPMVVVVLVAAGIGGGLVVRHMGAKRIDGATTLAPGEIERFPQAIPVERVAVGRAVQMRLLPPTRAVWAPGVLGVDRGRVAFFPSKARLVDRGWIGDVEGVELMSVGPRASAVRVHGVDGAAQFVSQMPVAELRAALEPFVPVAERA